MLKHYDFECQHCTRTFDEYVEGAEGLPEGCPHCGEHVGYKKLPSVCVSPQTIIVDYPGSKRLKAGYTHMFNRPAEKKGSQVSLYTPKK